MEYTMNNKEMKIYYTRKGYSVAHYIDDAKGFRKVSSMQYKKASLQDTTAASVCKLIFDKKYNNIKQFNKKIEFNRLMLNIKDFDNKTWSEKLQILETWLG